MAVTQPLAARTRPDTLDTFVGQEHLVAEGKPLRKLIQQKKLPGAMIFWGPPGTGKTTLARICAKTTGVEYVELSAVNAGKKDLEAVVNKSRLYSQSILLFLDEIHRFNKAQQDYLLPFVERGTIKLIGATTENPSFEVNSALLSRAHVFVFERLTEQEIVTALTQATTTDKLFEDLSCEEEALTLLARLANGDVRRALNILETAASLAEKTLTTQHVQEAASKPTLNYDKEGEEHYNTISALHKSMRDSDVQASVYWTMRLLEGGEDPKYVARRLIRFASEDVGNADTNAQTVANNTKEAVLFLGMPECTTALVQCAAYLAQAPKSNQAYAAANKARQTIQETGNLPVPKHLRNAPTQFMKKQGYGKGYVYAPDNPEAAKKQQHLPDELQGSVFYDDTQGNV